MTQKKYSILRNLLVAAMIFVGVSGIAQSVSGFNHLKKKYPSTNVVRLNREVIIDIAIKDNDIVIEKTSIDENLFLDESATQFSKESIGYSSFFQIEDVEASSFNIENGEYRENEVKNFMKKDELDGSFFDDVKSINFVYPNVNPGSKTRLLVAAKILNPRFLSSFYFGDSFPVVNAKLTINVDKDIDLDFKQFNTDSLDIEFKKKEKRNKITYSWQAKDVDAIKMEESTPNYKNYFPHVVPIISKYKTDDNKIVKLTSESSDLYKWYYSLIKDINKEPSNPELVSVVEKLTKNKDSEIEKVRAMYYWVQNNIKYIAFEYALGGFIPREANDVFRKKYGDCKDNSSILSEMFEIAEIEGNLTWIGTRSIPYKYDELPTPAVDNHMIFVYKNGDKNYFLDATARFIPLELPTSFIQGKEALVSNDNNKFEIIEVPVIDAEINAEIDSTKIYIENKQLKGSAKRIIKGYSKVDAFQYLESYNTESKLNDFYKNYLQKGNNKFIASNITEINKYDYDKDFIINYDFKISNYIVAGGDEVYVNLNLDQILLTHYIKEDRKTDIEIDYKKSYTFVNELNIPEGYFVDYLPENFKSENNLLSSSINYSRKDNKIIYTHSVKFDFLTLTKSEQKDYLKILKNTEKAYKELIVLKKINTHEK
ncbi:MAG: transglutaminase-like domain-containing protein [Bacteroidota bacterium]